MSKRCDCSPITLGGVLGFSAIIGILCILFGFMIGLVVESRHHDDHRKDFEKILLNMDTRAALIQKIEAEEVLRKAKED